MSSTNRGGQRTEADNYPTPPWCVHRLLEKAGLPRNGIWYEPCAGEGAIIHAVQTFPGTEGIEWYANEWREEAAPALKRYLPSKRTTFGDYLDPALKTPNPDDVRVVITNPPFRIAYEVLQVSLTRFRNAYVVLLLRLNFWGSAQRQPFMSKYPPDTYSLPNRPDFKGQGKTDSPEYAWMQWPSGHRQREYGAIRVLDATPLEERRSSMSQIIFPPDLESA